MRRELDFHVIAVRAKAIIMALVPHGRHDDGAGSVRSVLLVLERLQAFELCTLGL